MEEQGALLNLTSKEWLLVGTWFVTMVGWYITNRQANQRENRKEARAELEACCKMAAELLDKCRVYYSLAPGQENEESLGGQISFELKRVIARAERLQSTYKAFELIEACTELMDSVSGGDFQSKARQASNPGCFRVITIEKHVHYLIDKLEEGYDKQFRK